MTTTLPPQDNVHTLFKPVMRKQMIAPPAFRPLQTLYRGAVVRWNPTDELALALANALEELGHSTVLFDNTARVPDNIDIVFSFAPYGNFMALFDRLSELPAPQRPLLIH